MNKKQKKMLIRIIIAAVLIVVFSLLPAEGYLRFVLFMIPYLVIGYDILKKAFKGILNKQVFDENFLMAVATVGAILLGDYSEGVAVMLFYQIGELFQSYAVGKSRRNISELMDIRPDYANIEKDSGLTKRVLLTTCDTVATDTPAAFAISLIVAIFFPLIILSLSYHFYYKMSYSK